MLDDLAAVNERHERFLRRVVASGQVWGLMNADGWCVAPSNDDEDTPVMPF